MGNLKQTTSELIFNDNEERAVLQILIQYPCVYAQVAERLKEDYFYSTLNQSVYRCVKELAKRGAEISMTSVCTESSRLFPDIVHPYDIADICQIQCGNDISYHIGVVEALWQKRVLWTLGQTLVAQSQSLSADPIEEISKARTVLDDLSSSNAKYIFNLDDSVECVLERAKTNQERTEGVGGTPTGFTYLDSRGGIQSTDLVVVAAESSQGKTSFALSIVKNAILSNGKVAFYSLEMTKEQLIARILAMQTGIPSNTILNHPLTEMESSLLYREAYNLRTRCKDNLLVDERSTSNLETILISIRTMVLRYHIDGVVVDYLQILRPERGMTKEQFMGESARRLKDIAKELGIWVIALSQLSRDKDNPEPNVNRLRDSGQINEAADVTLLIYRPEAILPFSSTRTFPEPFKDVDTNGMAMITIGKGRNIGIGSFLCGFDAKTTHFYPKEGVASTCNFSQSGKGLYEF